MKVTKFIREYVEEEVSKVFDNRVNPYLEQSLDDSDMINAFKEKLIAQQKKSIEDFMSQVNLFEKDHYGNVNRLKYSTSIPSFYNAKTQAMLNKENWDIENQRAKKAKIREIIIALELGASRKELNEMISKLLEVEGRTDND